MKRQYYAVLAGLLLAIFFVFGLQKIGLAVVAIVASGSTSRICLNLQAKFLQERAEEGKTLA
jgi:hypothetical protein